MNNTKIKLTDFSTKGGCGCKISPQYLNNILSNSVSFPKDENLLVGFENSDDAGVYKINEDLAIVQTVDFFTPIVDDPYEFGQIAATNALSDIYAMGGQPKTALNLVSFPTSTLPMDVLSSILEGSASKVLEAGATVVGGHSIDDNEPKFGLSVTGFVNPNKYFENNGANVGDILILTKPIGVGIITTAVKRKVLKPGQEKEAIRYMTTLNKYASEILADFTPSAVTDVTGFGLIGHSYEMAKASNVSFNINYKDVPILNNTIDLAKKGIIPGGTKNNYNWLVDKVNFSGDLSDYEKYIMCDAVTSGGLLISINPSEAKSFIEKMNNHKHPAYVIGSVTIKSSTSVNVTK